VLEIAEALVGDDDGLEALAAHDRTQAATACEAVRVALHVRDGDASRLHAGLTRRAVRDGRVAIALGPHGLDGVGHDVVAGTGPLIDTRKRSAAVVFDCEHVARIRISRLAGHDDGCQAEASHPVRGLAAGVRLFESARERALGTDGEASAVGGSRSAEETRCEHEHVVRTQRIGIARNFGEHDGRSQRTSPVARPACRYGFTCDR